MNGKPVITSALALLLISLPTYFSIKGGERNKLVVHVSEVKGGQSVFIQTPNHNNILIDGGSNSEVIRQLTENMDFYDKNIEAIVLSKRDRNHMTGLIEVLRRYKVGKIIMEGTDFDIPSDEAMDLFYEEAQKHSVQIIKAVRGDGFYFGDLFMEVIFPLPDLDFDYSNASQPELVLRFKYGQHSFLFLGSPSKKIQKILIKEYKYKDDVLIADFNPVSGNTLPELIRNIDPTFFIYRSLSVKDDHTVLGGILKENRFDTKKVKHVMLTFDGVNIKVKPD